MIQATTQIYKVNCSKSAVGFLFLKLAPNVLRLCDGRQRENIFNRDVSGGYCKTAVSRWPFS